MIIDAHQHFWRIGENDCKWPTPDLGAIYRDFEPAELVALAAPLGVSGSVLVQSQESDRDTDWLIDLAAGCDFVKAVVGWTDLKAPHAPERIAALAAKPKLRGLRPMLQSLADDGWICDPALDPAIEAMIAHDLTFDALVYTRHLPHLRKFAERHPHLTIVIDHAAKPPIAQGTLDPWRDEIVAIAQLENVLCKLSGLPTEAAAGQQNEAFAPFVNHLLRFFGPTRLMWGSDWPVVNLATTYERWLAVARTLIGASGDEEDLVFCQTARMAYGIQSA
jgi:L-fuconolactonase